MTAWYYSDTQRNRLGPVAADQLADMHGDGRLAPDVLVWREGFPDWKPWRDVMDEVLGRGVDAPNARATFARAPIEDDGAGVNPYAFADARATAPLSPYAAPAASLAEHVDYRAGGSVVYAGFWKRWAAYAIDVFVVGIATLAVQMVVGMLFFGGAFALNANDPGSLFAGSLGVGLIVGMYVMPLLLNVAYYAVMHASAQQATLGKMAVGIKVVDDNGRRISVLRGIGRYFSMIPSAVILLIGFFMAAFTDRKRALHDMMAGTLVVDRWAYTSHPERQNPRFTTVTVVILVLSALAVLGYIALIGMIIGLATMAGR